MDKNKGRYDYSKSFAEQIEDYKNGLISKGDTLVVCADPNVFRKIGLSALPMTMNITHVDYSLNETKDFDHHLGESLLKQLPESIQHPVAILTSGTKNSTSIVAMLEIRHNGKQVVTPVVIDGFGKQNGVIIDSNAITSIYGKNYSISKVLRDAIEQEANGQFRLFYLNKNKATRLLQEARVPMPKNPATHDGGFIHTLADPRSPVKSKIFAQIDTQQFKRWFGRSIFRNADGTPKKVYHGTVSNFTVFERGNIGYRVETKEQAGILRPHIILIHPPRRGSDRALSVPAAGILHRKSSLCKQGEQDNVGMKRPYSALGAATAVRRVRRGFALGEAGSPSG